MEHSDKLRHDRNRVRRCYLLMVLLSASAFVLGGCLKQFVSAPGSGRFRVVSVEQDGTLLVRGNRVGQFGVKMYGIKIEDDWQDQLRARGVPKAMHVPRLIRLVNGPAIIIERDGRLVYDRKCMRRGPREECISLNIVEWDLLTPTRDEQGNILAIVVAASWLNPILVQSHLMSCGVADPDPDIPDDAFVDSLREDWNGLREIGLIPR